MLRQFGYMAALLMGGGAPLDAVAHDSAAHKQKAFDIADTRVVRIAGVETITIRVGEAASLIVTEEKDRFDTINVDSTAKSLSIAAEDESWFSGREYAITLTLTALDSLSLAGSVDGSVTGIDSQNFTLDMAGSVDLAISGKCGALRIDAAGRVDLDANDLICADVNVDAAGSTDIFVHATSSLDVDGAGANDVIYSGNPATISSDLAGAGSVEPAAQQGS